MLRFSAPLSALLCALVLAGCQPLPEFAPLPGPAAPETGDPGSEPRLVPVGQVLAAARGVEIGPQDTSDLEARAEALRRRAEALRQRQAGG